jgi:hypothetical protein
MIARFVDLVVHMECDETTRERRIGDAQAVQDVEDGECVLKSVVA